MPFEMEFEKIASALPITMTVWPSSNLSESPSAIIGNSLPLALIFKTAMSFIGSLAMILTLCFLPSAVTALYSASFSEITWRLVRIIPSFDIINPEPPPMVNLPCFLSCLPPYFGINDSFISGVSLEMTILTTAGSVFLTIFIIFCSSPNMTVF